MRTGRAPVGRRRWDLALLSVVLVLPMLVGLAVPLALPGCGATPAEDPGPKVGDKIIVARGCGADVWDGVEAMRLAARLAREGKADPAHPANAEDLANDKHRIGLVNDGDLVQIIDRGRDEAGEWVGIDVVREHFGGPGSLHGYTRPLWRDRPDGR